MCYITGRSGSTIFIQPLKIYIFLVISAIFLELFVNHIAAVARMAPPEVRRSQGRRKIEMKLIPDENARMVTFSKRRAGVFKKATELSVLSGAEIALIVFSPGGRAYSFGHPNVGSVLDRFFNRNPMPNLQNSVQGMRIQSVTLQELKEQLDQMNQELETEKRRGKEIEAALESSPFQITEERINLLDLNQLHQLKQMMEKLRENVRCMVNSMLLDPVELPFSMDVGGPSDPKKAARVTIEMDGRDDSPTPPVELRAEKEDPATDAKDDCDASPIPPDWLSL